MADGDELPDWDYESIYGREAMHARILARLREIEASMSRQEAALAALARASAPPFQPPLDPPPSSSR